MNRFGFLVTNFNRTAIVLVLVVACNVTAHAQSVCLPAPRLLTVMPMGGQVGTELDVVITGQHLFDIEQLIFSTPHITARAAVAEDGTKLDNQFLVTIADDCPIGIYEARVWSRLGLSSARAFSVGSLPEVIQSEPTTDVESALPIEINSIVNGIATDRGVNFFAFEAQVGERYYVDVAAKQVDSKMNPVLMVADDQGSDLVVERRGDAIDFTATRDGTHIVKVHDLTFKGGSEYFFRLAVRQLDENAPARRFPRTRPVHSASWPPTGLAEEPASTEAEPNNLPEKAELITLPCDIGGSFYPAADVDTFQFAARAGEVWWVEVASHRLGLPTDPSIVVQRVQGTGDELILTDLVELSDIPSPVKKSSNGYSYDGPPYDAGSSDILGKMEIQEDGIYQIRLSDLFGGTRSDPRNEYRLLVRRANPDFALVAWGLHMELRNGDRNVLSKPLALRGGATVALEVVVVRRDGFDGEIELVMESLPDGVSATGLTIASGQSRGIMLVTAHQDAPRGMSNVEFFGRAEIDGAQVQRPCQLASMAWPVPNAWNEIPSPRLLADIPVSVGGSEFAPISIAPIEEAVFEVVSGEVLTIPLNHIRRSEFSGTTLALRTMGAGFESVPRFDISIDSDQSEAVVDLTRIQPRPGDYTIAFYGSVVSKHQQHDTSRVQDIADIVVSEPITVRVLPVESQ